MKSGVVALVGRPNVGKSTLLNQLLKHKVSITSPKPQTTRFPIQAVYEDERGQIVFIDTPGIYGKAPDILSKKINASVGEALEQDIDLVVYIIDRTRSRDTEENKMLGMVRKIPTDKLLVINKTDIKSPDFWPDYAFYKDEFEEIVEISALKRHNFNLLLNSIFEHLPEREPLIDTKTMVQPGLNLNSTLFVEELIREKVFLFTHDELPYTIMIKVHELEKRKNGVVYVKADIITSADRYKKMLIGSGGYMIKKISMAARKELEQAANAQVFMDLNVVVDSHWMDML